MSVPSESSSNIVSHYRAHHWRVSQIVMELDSTWDRGVVFKYHVSQKVRTQSSLFRYALLHSSHLNEIAGPQYPSMETSCIVADGLNVSSLQISIELLESSEKETFVDYASAATKNIIARHLKMLPLVYESAIETLTTLCEFFRWDYSHMTLEREIP